MRISRELLTQGLVRPSPTLTVEDFLRSEIRHPVSPVNHPSVGLLFLPEAWSQSILNSGLVSHICLPVRKKHPWKRRMK